MFRPSLEEMHQLAATGAYRVAPVSMELFADVRTPMEVLQALQSVSDHCFLLESAEEHRQWGRYTFLGYEPQLCVTCRDGELRCDHLDGTVHTETTTDPAGFLRTVLAAHRSPRLDYLPTFTGGLMGYFSYDYIKYAEPSLRLDAQDTEGFQDVDLMLFDKVIAFDHLRQKMVLMVNMPLGGTPEEVDAAYTQAKRQLQTMAEIVERGNGRTAAPGHLTTPLMPLFSKARYCEMVETAKEHIREGDIFQIVLSNRLEAGFEGSLLDAYRLLRTTNPSPYLFYFSGTDVEVAGASPETLVKLEDGTLHTFPLAGTRPRGKTPADDAQLERELLADAKELSEHNMLVDLGRNDLGRVSEFGSVHVETLHQVLRFSHVMHLGSTVCGRLREGLDALDAIAAALPAGTLSGAPKLRACELINELEGNKRGIYGGAVGYLDLTGNMDTCIGIRLAYRKGNRVFVRSGAGIVADSVPEREHRECLNKAAAMCEALRGVEEAHR